jgi:hypothetical protein
VAAEAAAAIGGTAFGVRTAAEEEEEEGNAEKEVCKGKRSLEDGEERATAATAAAAGTADAAVKARRKPTICAPAFLYLQVFASAAWRWVQKAPVGLRTSLFF